MALIDWEKHFETGFPSVDHEHREMIGLLNELHGELGDGAQADTVADFLGEVFARISAHFALEETLMRTMRYDQYREHKQDHERLLDDIRDIMDEHEAGAYGDAAGVLAGRLKSWFETHFRTHDARFGRLAGH
jgi:hemerythrin-like metal-binding protein